MHTGALRFELVARKRAERGVDREHLERPAFVQMPDLVRGDAMPAADDASGQQEVDSRERRARSAAIRGLDQVRGTEDLAVVAALGMAFELELRDEFGGARVHSAASSVRAQQLVDAGLGARLRVDALDDHRAVQAVLAVGARAGCPDTTTEPAGTRP